MVEGKVVAWYTCKKAKKLKEYKEKYRDIRPIIATAKEIAIYGMGNEFLTKPDNLNGTW